MDGGDGTTPRRPLNTFTHIHTHAPHLPLHILRRVEQKHRARRRRRRPFPHPSSRSGSTTTTTPRRLWCPCPCPPLFLRFRRLQEGPQRRRHHRPRSRPRQARCLGGGTQLPLPILLLLSLFLLAVIIIIIIITLLLLLLSPPRLQQRGPQLGLQIPEHLARQERLLMLMRVHRRHRWRLRRGGDRGRHRGCGRGRGGGGGLRVDAVAAQLPPVVSDGREHQQQRHLPHRLPAHAPRAHDGLLQQLGHGRVVQQALHARPQHRLRRQVQRVHPHIACALLADGRRGKQE